MNENSPLRRVVIAAHKPLAGDPRFPDSQPRGGETSVSIIRDHLADTWPVLSIVSGADRFSDYFSESDVVVTWGQAAQEAHDIALPRGIPYILMVRWWRNVCPLPPGDLSTRKIPDEFRASKQRLFDHAAEVIANNRYAAQVVERIYGRECKISYVPALGEITAAGNPHGPIVLVTDGKDLGAELIVMKLAKDMPLRRFMVVNASRPEIYSDYSNITVTPYQKSMDPIWREAGIMIYPNYRNDVCGTSRVAPEAMRFGVPCLANDRAGICEKGMISIPRDADVTKWEHTIETIYRNYRAFSDRMHFTFKYYNTPGQLAVYKDAVEAAMR